MRRVVITGMGVVSPIGTGVRAYFDGLRSASPGISTIRSFDASSFPVRIAGEVRDLELGSVPLPADHAPALARDPKSVFGLLATREALAQARFEGYAPAAVGTYVGVGLEIFHLPDLIGHVALGRIDFSGLRAAMEERHALSTLQIPSHLGAVCAAREALAEGPLSVNVSACAAGTQAIGEAFHAVRDGAVDAALAGGYDSMVNPLGVGGFCMLEALSTQNELCGAASRPFDARRDGFVLGEGAGMVVLEQLERALARGAPILAELLGYGSTLDAYRVTDPAPNDEGAAAAMERALLDARLEPAQVDYINAHGTGTRKNDPAETLAIRAVFGEHAEAIPVSSTKSQIGHLIGAAGAVELLAGMFALIEQVVPATINLTHPDPECDLDYVPLVPRPHRVDRFVSSSFGFGGQNAVLVAGRWRP